eukprot:TRINITY_DN8615_c0_g1_i1.p1 TRINITY_DN8615_c0_g1~~TRINITY_DN8615_c0_g1_i1.p1  ORF type:complete len:765 (-),score=176.71 TRINITY_DN8615_c0_g1_i1:120-2414(-)
MDYFYQAEDKDGIRFSWNVWPSSRIDYKKLVIPIACMYTPLKKGTNVPLVYYNPTQCPKCTAYLNPYCRIDLSTNTWVCPFCVSRNTFPQFYSGMSETNLPAELLPECTTIEYRLPVTANGIPPAFFFVVDTAIKHDDELQHMKDCILQTIQAMPQEAFVGLITFGANVQVYELSYPHCIKAHVFAGEKDITPETVRSMLFSTGAPGSPAPAIPPTPQVKNRFIQPLSQVEFTVTSIIEDLQRDMHPYKDTEERPARASGVALSVALAVMEATFNNSGGRVMFFTGGPGTVGPGSVVGRSLKEAIRSHHHLKNEQPKSVVEATKYYHKLASRAINQGHAVDIISCSLDQTGLLEMHTLCSHTGGIIIQSESFQHEICKQSMRKLFEKGDDGNIKMRFNINFETIQSPEIKVCGAIGHLHSANNKSTHIGETVMGVGGTSTWKSCVIDPSNSFALYYEVVNPHNRQIQGQYGVVQLRTTYTHPAGYRVLRVTTVAHSWATSTNINTLVPGFDQEASAALIARLAVYKAVTEEIQPIKWIDRQLIQLAHTFGKFQKGNANSLELPPEFKIYPEFMFHLRRGNLIQVFGNSPDETSYFRHYLMRESVSNSLIMIQPALDAYAFDVEEPTPVLLVSDSIKPDRILVLDTFFHVVVYSGETIAAWRKAGYHEKEGHENFAQLLKAPKEDAENILRSRFPMPMYVVCDHRTSQSRFLLAVLDPGNKPSTPVVSSFVPNAQDAGTSEIYSDDVPLHMFMEHLKKRVVSYEP